MLLFYGGGSLMSIYIQSTSFMKEKYNFPNGGYEVHIVKKSDILETIDNNIIDKDIALALVEKLELDCANFLREGRWANIPYIGNIRVPKAKQLLKSSEQQLLIEDAYNNLDSDSYVMFRKQLNSYNAHKARFEKLFNYLISILGNKYNKYFNYLRRNKGEHYARIVIYTFNSLDALTEDFKRYNGYD